MAIISMRQLLETGVHFGHRARRWDPKMRRYIFTERNGIHIIDLQQTVVAIEDAYRLTRDIVSEGGIVLFVGTKRQAQETIETEARRCGMPFINQRWLGGTLTNWRTIRERIQHLKNLEGRRDRGEFELVTKKEALMFNNEIEKLNERLGGIREMTRLPDMLYIVDTMREDTAVHEANILSVPIVAMVDTNCNPELIDYVIPSNDDAIRAIKLITAKIADAVLEGSAMRKEELELVSAEAMEAGAYDQFGDEAEDEAYLGEATLAKLRAGALGFEGTEDEDELTLDEVELDLTEEDLGEEE